jgi:hypothetical protein
MPSISKMIPSNFLKVSDIAEDGNDGELDLTIADVRPEELKNDGEPRTKWVAYFKEHERGLVLNTTNLKSLAKLCGSDLSEDWVGKRVRLFVTPVQFKSEMINAIRIKAAPPMDVRRFGPSAAAVDEIPA